MDVRWSVDDSLFCGCRRLHVQWCQREAVSPMMLAVCVSKGESSVALCPPVAQMSRLCAMTRFFALTLISNHFFFLKECFVAIYGLDWWRFWMQMTPNMHEHGGLELVEFINADYMLVCACLINTDFFVLMRVLNFIRKTEFRTFSTQCW